jgi:NAD(P)-dependent dehydrogenase (short-subunit alcohol dehydrogenase family)
MRFKDQHIVILGGTSGIGLAVARAALDEGASVSVASNHQARVDEARASLVSRFSANIMAQNVDVTSEDALKDFFERTGPFDHLVFTAGEDLPLGLLVDKDLRDARARFETRYWGALASAKHGVRFIRKGGSIVFTSGFSSTRPRPGWTAQASIMSAVEGLTRALAVELAPIRVNAVSPGLARTPRWNSWSEKERNEFYRNEEKRLAVGRVGEAAEIATAYLYLMENSYATGTVIVADGGGALV